VAAAIFTIIFCIFKNNIASLYFGTKIADIDSSFIILVGIYNAILLTISAYTAALQSANITKVFLIWTPIQALVSILGQIACVGQWGIHGIVLGLMISYILVPLWIIPLTFKKRFNLAT
jgi:O-antigen/teichoic acid export membrane protein